MNIESMKKAAELATRGEWYLHTEYPESTKEESIRSKGHGEFDEFVISSYDGIHCESADIDFVIACQPANVLKFIRAYEDLLASK